MIFFNIEIVENILLAILMAYNLLKKHLFRGITGECDTTR